MSEISAPTDQDDRHEHPVGITIDGVEFRLTADESTPRALIVLAGKDPASYYLVQIIGKKERISYKDNPDEEIELREHAKFITVSTGPTPVS